MALNPSEISSYVLFSFIALIKAISEGLRFLDEERFPQACFHPFAGCFPLDFIPLERGTGGGRG